MARTNLLRTKGITLVVLLVSLTFSLCSCNSKDNSYMVGDYYLHLSSEENRFSFRLDGTGYLVDSRKNKNKPVTYDFEFECSGNTVSLKRSGQDWGVGELSIPSWYGDYVFTWQGESWYRKK